MPLLQVKHLEKIYISENRKLQVPALKDANFSVEAGDYVAIMGESGSGKTTLLNSIATLDRPTKGEIILNGKSLNELKNKELAKFRRENLGFIFQSFNLLDALNNKDNIFLPLVLARDSITDMEKRIQPLAQKLSIQDILNKRPSEISGGQKQRVAAARALITDPALILADEPTGALDSHTTRQLLNLLDEANNSGQTILMVTHSSDAASYAKRVLFIKDGKVFHQLYRGNKNKTAFLKEIITSTTALTKEEEV